MTLSKRIFDLAIVLPLSLVLIIPAMIIGILIKLNSKGPILYWSSRVGSKNIIFSMPKFRTMKTTAPTVATHLLDDPDLYLTSLGRVLRKISLDELPQVWSILRGDMSLVGPRPALFNQYDLIQARTERCISHLMPGLTGWAQVNGRDEISLAEKVSLDEYYLNHQSLIFDIKIIFITFHKVLLRSSISH